MRTLCLLVSAAVLFTISGCADGGATATAGAAVNSVCPCMGGKIDGETTVEWNGKTIGFCCAPCIDEWNEMSDEERTAALAGASSEDTDHADHTDHGDHDHGDHAEGDHEEPAEDEEPSNEGTSEETSDTSEADAE